MSLLAWLTLGFLAILLGLAGVLFSGLGRLGQLAEQPPREPSGAPLVSLVVAARDEARGIEAAARSLLAQQYPALEIIAVDDRSGDDTGAILDRLAAADARLRIVHVRELPPGWLGKNYALSVGAAAARGEWLLFADADIVMHPDTLSRAVGYAERGGLDQLAVMPDLVMPGLMLMSFATAFLCWGTVVLRPWRVRDPRTRSSVGIGAFNLVRRSTYQRVGGHAPIRLRPDDDLKLGKLLKQSGASCDFLLGRRMLSVEWYRSVPELIDGLMKNSFAVVEYHALPMLIGALPYLVAGLGPLAVLALGDWTARAIAALAILVQLGVMLRGARELGAPRRVALLYPAVGVLFAWITLRALVVNLWQRGIVWRGTFYPLSELRKNRV